MKGILNSNQIKKVFNTTDDTLRELRNEKKLPHFKIGRNYFYIEKHVLKWCENRSNLSIDEKKTSS